MRDCDTCRNYFYDEEEEDYICAADFDEDDVAALWQNKKVHCPFWQSNDDYRIVRHQAFGGLLAGDPQMPETDQEDEDAPDSRRG